MLSSTGALFVMILVSLLWGSWFQSVKHIGNYPIVAFMRWVYIFSVPVIWVPILFLQKTMIPAGLVNELTADPLRTLFVLICGCFFAIGMQMHLTVVGRIGLILSTSVSASCCILSGTAISAFFGGIPEGSSLGKLLFCSLLLILATIVCQLSGSSRDADRAKNAEAAAQKEEKSRLSDILLLVFINTVLISAYSLALSVGLASELRPNGMSSLSCMGVLAIGCVIGANIFASVQLRKEGVDGSLRAQGSKKGIILLMAFIAACCHFGGNVLQAIAAPVISVVVATVMGNSYHVWSYVWGIVYGEYKGASAKTYAILACGVALFLAGVLLLAI